MSKIHEIWYIEKVCGKGNLVNAVVHEAFLMMILSEWKFSVLYIDSDPNNRYEIINRTLSIDYIL